VNGLAIDTLGSRAACRTRPVDPTRSSPTLLRALAHELRNALAPIRNGAHLLRKRAAADPFVDAALAAIEPSIVASLALLDRAVDAERILSGGATLAVEDVDLATIVAAAVDEHRAAITQRSQRIRIELPAGGVTVRADATRLRQIVSQLVGNASKFSADGGDIRVSAALRDRHAVLRVEDDGVGMSPAFAGRVFEPFARPSADDPPTTASLGIGLPVCRKLVEMHGGRIEASSAGEGKGSAFVVTLPGASPASAVDARAGPSVEPAPAAASMRPRDRPRPRVLLVDDNPAVRETYTEALSDFGCDVETAADGEQALAVAQRSRPDFVILDINLPKRNGFEVARALRAGFTPREMTLVMISGIVLDESTLRAAKAAGFDHCLDKASDLAALARLFEA
jgi:CheY-like chemotaxis protein